MANTLGVILIQSIQMETLSSKLIEFSNLTLRINQNTPQVLSRLYDIFLAPFLSGPRSLINVNEWNEKLLKSLPKNQRHDIAIWLTRLNIGGPSGYAPVDGICDPARSCSLNRNENAIIGTNK